MDVQRSKLNRLWMGAAYTFLAFLSYYCCCYRLPVGVKYGVNVVVFGWAFLDFILHPRMEDMKYCLRFGVLFSVTYLIPWVWSMLIWIYQLKTFDYIIRGSLNIAYMLTCVMYVCASFYMFGEKCIFYSFLGMAAANLIMFARVGLDNGFGPLIQQYFSLLFSFAGKTGPLVRKLELHDLVFGWGVFLIYFAMRKTKPWYFRWIILAVSFFFFTLGFKRIGVLAVAAGFGVAWIYQRMRDGGRRGVLLAVFLAFTAAAFGYIYMVRSGLLFDITHALNLNLMGRETIYTSYNDFYEISPFYFGQGVRFVYQYGLTVSGITALHNDLLGLFIEVGFFVWFLWMWYEFRFRAKWIADRYTCEAAAVLLACSVYLYITFMTDNTFYYYPINVLYRMAVISWCWIIQKQNAIEGGHSLAHTNNPQLPNHV